MHGPERRAERRLLSSREDERLVVQQHVGAHAEGADGEPVHGGHVERAGRVGERHDPVESFAGGHGAQHGVHVHVRRIAHGGGRRGRRHARGEVRLRRLAPARVGVRHVAAAQPL